MNWNSAYFTDYPYPVTAKSYAWQENPEFGEKAGKEFGKLWLQIFDKGKPDKAERDVRRCIQQWPEVAGFQFLLAECVAHRSIDEALQILAGIATNHPQSFFAKLIQMMDAMRDEEEGPIHLPDFLEEATIPHLSDLYPDRTLFHAFEAFAFEAFLDIVMSLTQGDVRYEDRCTSYHRLIEGRWQFKLLDHTERMRVEPEDDFDDDDDYDDEDGYDDEDEAAFRAKEDARILREDAQIAAMQTDVAPVFQCDITQELYTVQKGMTGPLSRALLAADRSALIADLEAILADVPVRFNILKDDKKIGTPAVHALILLGHFASVASAPAISRFLAMPEPIIDYSLGDLLTAAVPEWLALIVKNDLQAFDALILDPNASLFSRCAAIDALDQVAIYWPDQKSAVIAHLVHLFTLLNAADTKSDSDDLWILNGKFETAAAALQTDALAPLLASLEDQPDPSGIHTTIQVTLRNERAAAKRRKKTALNVVDLLGLYEELNV